MNNPSWSANEVDPGRMDEFVRGGLRRTARIVANHGVGGALRLSARRLVAGLAGRSGADGEAADERRAAEEFDRTYGIETASSEGESLNLASVAGPNWRHGIKYQGARREILEIIDSLALAHEGSTFIDLGSGKGKVLFHAANHGFRRVVGVEYSRRLHETALANIGRYSNPARRCERIESVCFDAAAYEFPHEPSLVYLFNPFDRSVMERVVENLAASLRRHPRQIAILYCNALHADVFLAAGFREKARWSKTFASVLIEPGARILGREAAVP